MPSRPAAQPTGPAVHRAFEQLPEEERTLIAVVYWSGLSRAEAASRLNVPLATLTTRARSALGQLADLLQ